MCAACTCVTQGAAARSSVLTAYVGVTGLLRRLAIDKCLPQFLLARNQWRGTNHWIVLLFWGACVSMYFILNGNLVALGKVYRLGAGGRVPCIVSRFASLAHSARSCRGSITFLGVMITVVLSCAAIKFKRNKLPRPVDATWASVFLALVRTVSAIVCVCVNAVLCLRVCLRVRRGCSCLPSLASS